MIYKTRVKQYTSMPYFEAGTERFVRDWRSAVVRVQVRDARYVLVLVRLWGERVVLMWDAGCARRIRCWGLLL